MSCRNLAGANGPYARKKKMVPAGHECYNVSCFDGFYI